MALLLPDLDGGGEDRSETHEGGGDVVSSDMLPLLANAFEVSAEVEGVSRYRGLFRRAVMWKRGNGQSGSSSFEIHSRASCPPAWTGGCLALLDRAPIVSSPPNKRTEGLEAPAKRGDRTSEQTDSISCKPPRTRIFDFFLLSIQRQSNI